jgi:class 3 adenylate cyclase/predicted ATPase
MATIKEWLETIGLGIYADSFERQTIGLDDLGDLTDSDLQEIGLSIGHRKRFLRARAQHLAIAMPVSVQAGETPAERRHLTVMFCDMVGSAALSERLEAEDLLAVLRHYRTLCRKAVENYGGVLARLVGDGVLAYFGYPTAHENDSERAIRAALEITAGIGSLENHAPLPLKVRIGVATGFVLVGDLFDAGEDARNEIVGTVPNLAARLQAIAPENAVVVAPATWRLVRNIFSAEDLGSRSIRGLEQPIKAWRVLGERYKTGRPGGDRSLSSLTPIVNREVELRTVQDLWSRAYTGKGQALLITGEAGIGKSRLVAEFLGSFDPPPQIRQYFCSPFLSSSPLGSALLYFSAHAAIERDDSSEIKLEKLATLVAGTDRERQDSIASLAWLFSLPYPQDGATEPTPRQRRERALRGLAEQFLRLRDGDALIGVIEDLHWADPTTLEFIELLLDRLADRPALLVLTSREEPKAPWRQRPELTHIEIERLPEEQSSELVHQLGGADALRPLVVREILLKADGIPLFIEELTQSVVESLDTRITGVAPSGLPRIPATLHESLLARLDRAGPGKELAQICAVIGRTAGRELVEVVADLEPSDLARARDTLARSGILFMETSRDGREQYVFKHSLVQETAYASLIRERRRELHARVAAVQLLVSPEAVDLQPEVLAHHLTEAGRVEDALEHWLRAGRRGLQRSANLEATVHLRCGLHLLDSLPVSPERQDLRLQYLILLAPALISAMGPGTVEVGRLYAEAVDICRSLPESSTHFPVYWGWWRVSPDFRTMRQRADDLLRRAQTRGDDALLLQAHHCQWASHFNAGDFAGSAAHIDGGLRIYETGDYRSHASLYGNHDAKVCAHGERSLIFWLEGNLDGALDEERRSLAWAQEIAHAGSRSHAMDFALMHRVYRRDAKRVLSLADEIIRFSEDQGFSDPEAKGIIFRGWAKTLLGDVSGGLREVEVGILRQRDIGTTEDFPIYHCMLAEAHMLAGQVDRAIDTVLQARRESENIGLEIWLPELWRWLGVLGRHAGQDDRTIEGYFIEALNIARRQSAVLLELRAALDLAALRRERGDISSAGLIEQLLKRIIGGRDSEERHRATQFLSEFGVAGR